jgi:hypothetical protein
MTVDVIDVSGMSVDVALASRLAVDVATDAPGLRPWPGAQRPFPQSIWPAQGPPGTVVQIGGFQFVRFGTITWVRVGTDLYTASNGTLTIIDDSRLTFTTRAGGILGMALDVVVGAGSLYDANHTGVLPTAFANQP